MNTGEHFQRAKNLFISACELRVEDRAAFLEDACENQCELRSRVEELLAAEEESLLRTPARKPPAGAQGAKPDSIEGYRLVAKIGDGGMGEVWEAEQEGQIQRRVAIKLIRWGMDSEQVVARFETERQSLAVMDHPSIAKVLEAGSTDNGRPYFAMELVDGLPITRYCDTHCLNINERLRLFVQVCMAVQHAHQKGIIHRDLKPANILVTDSNGEPMPKIIDFGIARAINRRLTKDSFLTEFGQWIGTPEYMSPEQTAIPEKDVDTRADVYSLGVVLYELLVGCQPLRSIEPRKPDFDEMRRRICEVEPLRPSTQAQTRSAGPDSVASGRKTTVVGLVRTLRGDLDWLTMKALEKDRDRRYVSPAELANEIERYLRHEPVEAGPPSQWYKLRKFVRRNRIGVTASLLVAAALASGMTIASAGLVRAKLSERAASVQAEKAQRVTDFLESLFDSLGESDRSARALPARNLLENGASKLGGMFPDEPEVRARMMATIGRVSARFGYYDLSESLFTDAVKVQRNTHGNDDSLLADSLSSLAWSAHWMGDPRSAVQSALEARSIYERTLGPSAPRTLTTMSALGFFLSEVGDHETARDTLERALEIGSSAPSPNRLVLASIKLSLGEHHLRANRLEQAGEYINDAVAARADEYGTDHPSYAWALFYLGRFHTNTGNLSEARSCFERVLEIHNRTLFPGHPDILVTLGVGAFVLLAQGDIEAARRDLEIASGGLRNQFGSDHFNLIWLTRGLAMCHRSAGDLDEAESLARESLRIADAVHGKVHLDYAESLLVLGYTQYRKNQFRVAHGTFLESLEIYKEVLGPKGSRLDEILYNMACMSALVGETDRALLELRESVDIGFAGFIIFDDSDLDVLRGNPDFERMVRDVKQRNQADSSE